MPVSAGKLNYRHGFHAGNYADVVKHMAWVALITTLQTRCDALEVIDAHGGAGLYVLDTEGEARTGALSPDLQRHMATLPIYWQIVSPYLRRTPPAYPGSPALIGRLLRPSDRLSICEIQAEQADMLRQNLKQEKIRAEILRADGYTHAAQIAPYDRLVLLDPPFEATDEWEKVISATQKTMQSPRTTVGIWLPIKDYSAFDNRINRLKAALPPHLNTQVIESLMHQATNPIRMNGCAVVIVGAQTVPFI